jgi:urocanate hydratase
MGGVARRAWARNDSSIETVIKYNDMRRGSDHITLPFLTDEGMVEDLVSQAFEKLRAKPAHRKTGETDQGV